MDAALTTALTALTVAILGAGAQVWQLRVKQRLDRDSGAREQAATFAREELKLHHLALKEVCQALQGFQDELMLLAKSRAGALLAEERRARLTGSRDKVLKSYQLHHPVLDHHERVALSEARDRCVDIVFALADSGTWHGEYVELDERLRDELDQASADLAYRHQQLLFGGLQRVQAILESSTVSAT